MKLFGRISFFITILLSLLSLDKVHAQNMSVTSFVLDEMDLTANVSGTTVLDQNGEKCALIKIKTTQKGFTFDVGFLGVMHVEYKTAAVWVYVPYGIKKIEIAHPELGSVTYSFSIPIQKAKTYVMELVAGEVQTIVKKAVTSQYVLFELTPVNAIVEFDGEILENFDGTASVRKPFGTYSYRVQAPRHNPEDGVITVNDPKNKHIVKVSLEPLFSVYNITAPLNSEIYVNERKQGTSSCSVELSYGTYMLEARLDGHRSSYKELTIDKSTPRDITLDAPIPIYGSLDVNSAPGNAEVWLDDKLVGTTPLFIEEVLIGTHDVMFKKPGYEIVNKTVSIVEGEVYTLQTEIKRLAGTPVITRSSSSSETANCYIISKPGTYKIKAVKGNSFDSVGDVASLEVIWETFGTSVKPKVGDLVQSLKYSNGIIEIETNPTYKKGNALIAAKDASGNILWSWHLWFTEKPEDQVYFNNVGTVMDRNLGAISATPGDVGALGLLYQWGRKDPFLGASSIDKKNLAKSTITWPKPVESDASNGTIEYAQTHPTTFILGNNQNYDWHYTGSHVTENSRWGSEKTIYDPCPVGYHIYGGEDDDIWLKAYGVTANYIVDNALWNGSNKGINLGKLISEDDSVWFPAVGYINPLSNKLEWVGDIVYYWHESFYYWRGCATQYYKTGTIAKIYNPRSMGASVRCVREEITNRVAPPTGRYTDLSVDGQTANSYMILMSGNYKFPAVQGNSSTPVGNVSSVEVLWETFGTSNKPEIGDLVKSVNYNNGWIEFETNPTYRKGNALIAAKDATGNILWSWHLWFTDKPINQLNNGTKHLMDRNLGATSATPGDVGTLGLMYQWGRKDPFLGAATILGANRAKSTLSWPSPVDSDSSTGSIEYAQSHPTTFIIGNRINHDWYYTGYAFTDNTRWQSQKTIYDPCPVGYKVPRGGENGTWNKVRYSGQLSSRFQIVEKWNKDCFGMNFGGIFGVDSGPYYPIWYPAAGELEHDSSQIEGVGEVGYYWSVTPTKDGDASHNLFFNDLGGVNQADANFLASGLSVRCIRE